LPSAAVAATALGVPHALLNNTVTATRASSASTNGANGALSYGAHLLPHHHLSALGSSASTSPTTALSNLFQVWT
jgi:hypothetical protein